MAKTNRISSEDMTAHKVRPGYSDDTADRLRAYLNSLDARNGAAGMKNYLNGAVLIERSPASAKRIEAPTFRPTQ